MQSLSKKGHVEAYCWKKQPDKIPKKVKAARKKKEEKKTSIATAAIESKGEDIILGAIECGEIIFEPLDIAKGYYTISLKEKNYVYFSDNKDSLDDKDGEDEDKDKGNSNDDIEIEKKNETFQNATVQEEDKIKEFDVSSTLTCAVSTVSPTIQMLESKDLWIADMGATSHVTKHVTGGIKQHKYTLQMKGCMEIMTANFEMDIPVMYCNKDGNKIR
jgi:hypothetical protein